MNFEIVIGDCRDALKAFRSGSFHACLTDPPYLIPFVRKFSRAKKVQDGRDTWYNTSVPRYEEWLPEVVRVLKPASSVMIFEASKNWRNLYDSMERAGIRVIHTLIWYVTNRDMPFKMTWTRDYDVLIYGLLPPIRGRTWNNGTDKQQFSDVFASKWCTTDEDVAGVKPVQFLRNLIRTTTRPGDAVIDPFMGSGTTLKAASLEGRKSVGIEVRREVALAVKERMTYHERPLEAYGS